MFSKMTININSDTHEKCPWQTRVDYLSQKVLVLQKRLKYMELSRFIIFISLIVLVYYLWQQPELLFYSWLLVTGGILLFVGLVFLHHHIQEQLQNHLTLVTLNTESLERIHRNFPALAPCPIHVADHFSEQDRALNLYGTASLGQLLFNLSTSLGDSKLAVWITRGCPISQLSQHQQAIKELAPQLDLRQKLYACARKPDRTGGGYYLEKFHDWATSTTFPYITVRLKRVGQMLTLLSLVCITCAVIRFAPGWIVIPPVAMNIVFLMLRGDQFKQALNRVDLQSNALNSLSKIVRNINSGEYHAQTLRNISELLQNPSERPELALRKLSTIIHYSHLRFNALPYLVLQCTLLWDFHITLNLQGWHKQYAQHVPRWLEAISLFEALSAMANLSHENQCWHFPTMSDERKLHAKQAIHPLLPAQQAIANDILLIPGQVTIITGSNMSGKTTYMRTLGLNLKLAMAGGPVACSELIFHPCELFTIFSAADSLHQGLSYFMSEVLQIKELITRVKQSGLQPIYLLDELLKGTNERERNMAIIAILKKLCAQQAMGMITTHSTILATDSDLQPLSRNIYFEETIDDKSPDKIFFSYRLKEGISHQTNAIKLFRMLGVDLT
ncbi:recombination and DNA strand exchange inhibitor protein [Xenorhabdus sp. KK7.4]|nr:recombination and DNA strand exchange inhibitor protein [Xenorhabdus sp. KK7.4]